MEPFGVIADGMEPLQKIKLHLITFYPHSNARPVAAYQNGRNIQFFNTEWYVQK